MIALHSSYLFCAIPYDSNVSKSAQKGIQKTVKISDLYPFNCAKILIPKKERALKQTHTHPFSDLRKKRKWIHKKIIL